MSLSNGVRYRSLGPNEHLDMTLDVPAVTHSIAVLLEVAAKVGVDEPMLENFEQALEYCWKQFEVLGDISVDISDYMIVAHTRHDPDAPYQVLVVLMPAGSIFVNLRMSEDEGMVTRAMQTSVDWREFVQQLNRFPTNVRRRIRGEGGKLL